MPNFFAISDFVARALLAILPRRIASRIKENTSPLEVLVLRNQTIKCDEPRMTLFEGVFATLLFDLALFGTSNPIINGIISLFTTIQNSWDASFKSEEEAESKVTEFCNRLDIQQQPWIWEKPITKYTSLNDFFSRTYSPNHFPELGTGTLVSPACCKILSYSNDMTMKSILIKGCDYDINKIGLPEGDLQSYASNRVYLGYLSPKDYHRVHSPIHGRCIHCKMEGEEHKSASVKFFGGKFNILNENKRLVIVLEELEVNGGREPLRVALVVVGGVGVDTITYDHSMVGNTMEKGQELSAFRAGGSAFALFTSKPLDAVEPLRRAAESGMHVEAIIGETLVN
ncbi:predicted protein [Thalassiosira pseudonana CCMP1335]|uniref:Phosphatidylserine decarboxylase n=1 Tax=Thalassiosira pseudonana TaxID=35128 RepID=B5YMK3_THAPS|nr:predicted protein [Thalassiosira pseudonana CCMP1335]ACI64476.1 predicted protein [Thalassiosira pseudonana CCMP1335]